MNDKSKTLRPFIFEQKDKYGRNYKRTKYFFILMGVFWTITGIVETFSGDIRFYPFILVTGGPLFILQAIISEKNQRDRYIKLSDEMMEFKQSWRKATAIPWTDIKVLQINNLAITIIDHNSSQYTIKLDELQYSDVQEIKNQFRRFAETKEITFS